MEQELFVPNRLKETVRAWRQSNYACNYPVIAEILNYSIIESEEGDISFRYLRKAQFEALETYWYLRLVKKTPRIFELYEDLYEDKADLLAALRVKIPIEEIIRSLSACDGKLDCLFERIRSDDEFVKENRLETVRESLVLDYPSYIFALAMGAGKTVLIGSIIATEFAMALSYYDTECFVTNALVFAPGKTILGALREISDIPFNRILPPRLYQEFISSWRPRFTRDNEKDIPISTSHFNVIVTNTEKIRIQKPTSKKQLTLLNFKERERYDEAQQIANLRLQTIAALPNLAIFSDEAHHTYGQSLGKELKRVRQTVDYLARSTKVVTVVNTTGTPYYKKQILPDVVFWYGLSEGIKDGVLKEVKDSIYSYKDAPTEAFLELILVDFFGEYESIKTYDGAPAKIAIYFPQIADLQRQKPWVDSLITKLGLSPSTVLEVHEKSDEATKDFFDNRINQQNNPYRVYLLVNKGTEGWNCPSLFATALARKLRSSNNFVLQAASRCLRQSPGNSTKARIYLSKDNEGILDQQLAETFKESLDDFSLVRCNKIRDDRDLY